MEPTRELPLKLVLIGDASVGKTALLLRLTDHRFYEHYYATCGIDFRIRKYEVDGRVFRVQIWDTAGQERFKCITARHYKGTSRCT